MISFPLPLLAPLAGYLQQAEALLAAHRAGDRAAIRFLHQHHPRFLDPVVKWKSRDLADAEIAAAELDLDDAKMAVARAYAFRDWHALVVLVGGVATPGSAVHRFERAAEAVIDGDAEHLAAALRADPSLVRARSTRITCHEPPVHGATLLHYLAANGVEDHRQRSPANAVDVARQLLQAGAAVDALAGMYGGECATLSMLVSSTPPAAAGVQVPLIHVLLDFGAAIDGCGAGPWSSPLRTALVFGFRAAANALVARGAAVDKLMLAAGVGRAEDVARMLAAAPAAERHGALALAAQLGHGEVVRILLDAGEDPNRFNPEGMHAHATPLHHAALAGHAEVVRLLVTRGARLDRPDRLWHATPRGWAEHAGRDEVADYLRSQGG